MTTSNWSEPYTSSISNVQESSHRIAVSVNLDDETFSAFLSDFKNSYFDHYFCHIVLVYQRPDFQDRVIQDAISRLERVVDQMNESNRIYVTLQISGKHSTKLSSSSIILSKKLLRLILLDIQDVFETNGVAKVAFPLSSAATMPYGLINFASNDLIDSFLQREASSLNNLKFVGVSCKELPDLRTRALELIHSYGLNSIVSFPSSNFLDSPTFRERIEDHYGNIANSKYEISPFTFVGKVYLQLGVAILIPPPLSNLSPSSIEIFKSDWSRLVHPFVHRKTFVSPVRIISLWIEAEDVEAVVDLSDSALECLLDKERVDQFATVYPKRPQYEFRIPPPP